MEALLKMGEEKQRETLIAAATIRNSSRLTEQERLQLRRGQAIEADHSSKRVSMKSMVSFRLPETVQETSESPEKSPIHSPDCRRKVRMMDDIKEEEESSPDPRKAMMAMLAKRGGGGGDDGGSSASSSASTTVALKDCPKYGKYFKMMKVRD